MQSLAVFSHILAVLGVLLPVEIVVVIEVPGSRLHRHSTRDRATDALHHGKVFTVVVRLEEGVAQCNLEDDASDGPDVTGLCPTNLHDDLGCSVVAGRHNTGVVLVVEGSAAEIDQSELWVSDSLKRLACLVVVHCVVGGVEEEDVLRLEVGVGDSISVEKVD